MPNLYLTALAAAAFALAAVPLALAQEASSRPTEDESGGYLFATFKGEETPLSEQIYLGLSTDGLNWTPLNDGEPVLVSWLGERGVRDPFLLRGQDGETFYLIATDLSVHNINHNWGQAVTRGSHSIVIWESHDLVHWSPPRLVEVAPEDAGCTWAPQAIYDRENGDYLVYWASTTERDGFDKHRIWAARTPDFKTFSEPFIYIERAQAVIDTDVIFDPKSDRYFRFSKNESSKAIDMETSETIMGDWSQVAGFTLDNLSGYEGPSCFRLRDADGSLSDRWCLLLDHYARGEGYKAWVTDDLASGDFSPTDEASFPFRFRHGSVLTLSDEELDRVRKGLGR